MDAFLLDGGTVLHNLCSPELESQLVCALAELQIVALQGFVLKEYEVKLHHCDLLGLFSLLHAENCLLLMFHCLASNDPANRISNRAGLH